MAVQPTLVIESGVFTPPLGPGNSDIVSWLRGCSLCSLSFGLVRRNIRIIELNPTVIGNWTSVRKILTLNRSRLERRTY